MSKYKLAIICGVVAFVIHFTLVAFVLILCQTDKDPDIIILWTIFRSIDFAVVRIIDLIQPEYNVPLATTLMFLGGLQWACVGFLGGLACSTLLRIRR
jgi:hypothetical protein